MNVVNVACLKQISNYLQTPVSKLTVNSEKMPTCTLNNTTITGFVNITANLVKQSQSSLLGSNIEDQCEVRQWLEYCVTYASYCNNTQCANQILQELNSVLETRTYLVGNNLTVADVAVFYTLQDLMEKLTYHQKEKYLNLSRWFDNIQQSNNIGNKNTQVDFSTLFLTSVSVR